MLCNLMLDEVQKIEYNQMNLVVMKKNKITSMNLCC